MKDNSLLPNLVAQASLPVKVNYILFHKRKEIFKALIFYLRIQGINTLVHIIFKRPLKSGLFICSCARVLAFLYVDLKYRSNESENCITGNWLIINAGYQL